VSKKSHQINKKKKMASFLSTTPSSERLLPVTERENSLTTGLDVASPQDAIRLIRQADQQIFTGYDVYPSLLDQTTMQKIQASVHCVINVLRQPKGRVILSGSGTSGRLGMLIARDLNRVVRSSTNCSDESIFFPPFGYSISGGDAAMLLSDEVSFSFFFLLLTA